MKSLAGIDIDDDNYNNNTVDDDNNNNDDDDRVNEMCMIWEDEPTSIQMGKREQPERDSEANER